MRVRIRPEICVRPGNGQRHIPLGRWNAHVARGRTGRCVGARGCDSAIPSTRRARATGTIAAEPFFFAFSNNTRSEVAGRPPAPPPGRQCQKRPAPGLRFPTKSAIYPCCGVRQLWVRWSALAQAGFNSEARGYGIHRACLHGRYAHAAAVRGFRRRRGSGSVIAWLCPSAPCGVPRAPRLAGNVAMLSECPECGIGRQATGNSGHVWQLTDD